MSQGTVSKVLNEAPGVGPGTRSRVLKVIEDLDYHPDASARSLVARKTGSIGVIIPHTGSYSMASAYWPVLLTAITEAAAARSLNVLLSTARSEEDVDSAYQSILRGRKVDGLVVGAEQFGQRQLVQLLFKGFPFVTVGKSRFVSHWHVDVDNAGGARAATSHLLGLGHRRLAMLAGPSSLPATARSDGLRTRMPPASSSSTTRLPCHCLRAWCRLMARLAPWQAEPKRAFMPVSVPASTQLEVPIVPPISGRAGGAAAPPRRASPGAKSPSPQPTPTARRAVVAVRSNWPFRPPR